MNFVPIFSSCLSICLCLPAELSRNLWISFHTKFEDLRKWGVCATFFCHKQSQKYMIFSVSE